MTSRRSSCSTFRDPNLSLNPDHRAVKDQVHDIKEVELLDF